MRSGINPFDSQEAKPYKNDPEILAMTNLVVAYQNNDINEFESILRTNRNNIMADAFIKEHLEGNSINNFLMPLLLFVCTSIVAKCGKFLIFDRFAAKYSNTSAD